jgi:hypothetical protein
MAGIDFPKIENRAPEIFISLHLTVKLAATDDKQHSKIKSKFLRNYLLDYQNLVTLPKMKKSWEETHQYH